MAHQLTVSLQRTVTRANQLLTITTDFTRNDNVCIKHVVFIALWIVLFMPFYLTYLLQYL